MKETAQIQGQGSTKVEGLHDDYSVTLVPTWHADAQRGQSCVGLHASLEIRMHFSAEAEDPGAVRQRLEGMLSQGVKVQAPGLRFQGYVRSVKWLQRVGGDGELGSASVTLVVDRVQGPEP